MRLHERAFTSRLPQACARRCTSLVGAFRGAHTRQALSGAA